MADTPKDQTKDKDKELTPEFQKTVKRLLDTPPKPHKTKPKQETEKETPEN
jgi:hypothetical protein